MTKSAAMKIMHGLMEALAFAKCDHRWDAVTHRSNGTVARICSTCGAVEYIVPSRFSVEFENEKIERCDDRAG